MAFIEMKVAGLTIDTSNDVPIVVLKEVDGARALRIYIGYFEASAIAIVLEESVQPARPMTHDLIRNVLDGLAANVLRVEVNDLRNNTFFASIFLELNGQVVEIDSRPSDAIAVALRTDAPVMVDDVIIEQIYSKPEPPPPPVEERAEPEEIQELDQDQDQDQDQDPKDKWLKYLEDLSPEDFGKYKM